ncbi:MAG: hypothetical protein ACK55I_20070, partial [bacterium]
IQRFDPATERIVGDFELARQAFTDSEIAICRYVEGLDVDASALEQLREELSELARLERKYRLDDAGLAARLQQAKSELQQLGEVAALSVLEKEVASLYAAAESVGRELRTARQKAGKQLQAAVARDLAELAMGDASL